MSENQWLMRIEGGLSAHFKESNGKSRPGVQWAIGLKRGAETHKVLVKALFTDDATTETQKDQEYQAQIAMQYVSDQIANGWHPEQEKHHVIYIGNRNAPLHEPPIQPTKRWWQLW